MALAVGILVDDGTVTIENINYHLEQGKDDQPTAILDGAQQIVIPAFVTLLCLCIVFVPMFLLGGVAGYLFRPMAEAVVFALIGSFLLSRTLVPTMAYYLLRHSTPTRLAPPVTHPRGRSRSRNPFKRFQRAFDDRFITGRASAIGRCCRWRSASPQTVHRRLPRLRHCCRSGSSRFSARTSSRRSTPDKS